MVNLIKPQKSEVQGTTEFYTVEETGESGMSQSGLAVLCGVKQPAISQLERTLISRSPSRWLDSFVGQDLTLISTEKDPSLCVNGKRAGKLTIYKASFCARVIQHYSHQDNPVAQHSESQFLEIGINTWIQGITGWSGRTQRSYIPYWYQRIYLFTTKTRIPDGWWCVFQELAKLMMDLEGYGYALPDTSPTTGKKITPDISIGQMFCRHMRSLGYDVDGRVRKYDHHYPDSRGVRPANIYPREWWPEFDRWFNETWKRERLLDYLGSRDPEALPSISRLLGLPEADSD